MPKAAEYRLIWCVESGAYELQNSRGEPLLRITIEESTWFDWLISASSFTFRGKYGQLTVRKESRQRGDTYWYAYHRRGQKMASKYLGRSADLTFARLEEVSLQLAAHAPDPAQEMHTQDSLRERTPDQGQSMLPKKTPLETTGASMLPMDMLNEQPDLRLITKLHAPRLRPSLVPRTHLVSRLHQISTSRLTLLSAPAGFGKTTLLCQWLTESVMPVAWLSLEPEDNESVRFLSYVIAALQTLDPQIGNAALSLLFSSRPTQPTLMETVLTVLTNDLAKRVIGDIALVLDDYHVIQSENIQRAVASLVEHCPSLLHLVIATRADPALSLARFRARGQLIELRAAQLQFALDQTSAFLSTVMGLDLPSKDIAVLQERTEGWIAGLQLAALSLQGRGDVEQFLAEFTGSHRHVADYLIEEVLSRQSEEVQSFLLHTSILDRLTGPLCDAVADRSGSEAVLGELERANLFLVPLDEQRQWYRYHQLFADMLRARLRRKLGVEGMAALYRKASDWYQHNGFPTESVEAALVAADFQRAADLIDPLSVAMVLRSQHSTLRHWLERLPKDMLFTRPALCFAYAMTLFVAGQGETYQAALQEAERLFRAEGNDRGVGQVLMVRALAASLRGDALEGIALGKEALALLPEQAGVARSGSVSAMAEGYRRTGDVMAAWRVLNEAQPIDERIGNLLGMAGNAILRARLLVMQGKLRQAAESYHTVIGSMSERHEFVLEALIGLADLLREWNELAEALTHLEHVIALALEIRNELLLARAALSRARIIQVCGDAEQAEAAFASAVVQAQQSGNQSLMAEARIYQARWWLVQGNREEASRWRTANAADYQQELAVLTLVRALLAHDEADEALGLLDECCKHARAQGRIGSEIEIMTLMALAYHTLGKSDFALQALQRALLLAEPGGYVRLFVDEGVPMAMLLRTLLSEWKGKPGIDYLHKLLAILKTDLSRSLTAKALEPPPLFEPLSQRERKVLRLLAAGMSNPEIANELVVSLNTVKTQVQSLYRKLNVSGRKEAIAVAKRLQLV